MELRNCSRCGALFPYAGSSHCRDCVKDMDKQYEAVRECLASHPEMDVEALSRESGVDHETILHFLREGRLVSPMAEISCERCGRPIASGRYCVACTVDLTSTLKSVKPRSTFYGAPRIMDKRSPRNGEKIGGKETS